MRISQYYKLGKAQPSLSFLDVDIENIAVKSLHEASEVDAKWWATYRQMQIETKETTYEQLMERNKPKKISPSNKQPKKIRHGQ